MSDDFLSEEPKSRMRLDTWKGVADYLGRNPRTAQRWYHSLGLPVHYLRGSSGTVFAYSDEIDEWFRRNREKPDPENEARPFLIQMPATLHADEPQALDRSTAIEEPSDKVQSRAVVAEAFRLWAMLTGANLHLIARSLREAIDLDPGNAEAYAGLAHAMIAQGLVGNVTLETAYSDAEAAAQRALQIDPHSSEAICARAWLDTVVHRNWHSAAALFERVLRVNPTTRAMVGRALLHVAEGDCESGSEMLFAAWRQNSLSSLSLGLHAWSEYLTGNYREALNHVAEAREAGRSGPILEAAEALACVQSLPRREAICRIERLLRNKSRSDVPHGALAYLLGSDGSKTTARAILQKLSEHDSHDHRSAFYAISLAQLGLEERELSIQSIERSYEAGSLWSLGFHLDPALQSLAGEADFQSFVRRAYPVPTKFPQSQESFNVQLTRPE